MSNRIRVYLAQSMTGKMCDEMLLEAQVAKRALENFGFEVLSPVLTEGIPYEHRPLTATNKEELLKTWLHDKEMLRDSDIFLDYMSCGKSNGVNNEIGYMRWCTWKPVVRVWPNAPLNISTLEDDAIVSSLGEAIHIMLDRWGSYEKLRVWRQALLDRSMPLWMIEHHKMNSRYGVKIEKGII